MAESKLDGRYKTLVVESRCRFEQESERMERLPTKQVAADEQAARIPLVSLGCSCAPKMSFKEMGRGSETLPFDWIRSTLDGVVHFLASDFANYFQYSVHQEIPLPNGAKPMHMFQSPLHSFWHDDPRQSSMVEKYNRRIARFNCLDAHTQPVLFVRSAASSDELMYASFLMRLLVDRFGSQACLLMIVDFQGSQAPGAFVVANEPNLMINLFNTESVPAPHAGPIRTALDWVLGRKFSASQIASPEVAMNFVQPTDWGLFGTSGDFAFEGVQVGADSVARLRAMQGPPTVLVKPAREGEQASDVLEKTPFNIERQLDPLKYQIPLVSLGSSLTPKLSFKALGLGAEAYPFDWLRVSLRGLIHFIRNDFKGFFEFATLRDVYVPNLEEVLTMYRSQYHSFWYDDPRHSGMRESYLKRISNFHALSASTHPVLFVRAVATTHELKYASMLTRAIIEKFGVMATLLLIIDFQDSSGAYVVQDEPNLMLYFLKTKPVQAPHCDPIVVAMEWAAGKRVSAAVLPNINAALPLLREDHSQLTMGGVPIFEESGL